MSTLAYSLLRGKRKTISLTVDQDGDLVVKAPNRVPKFVIDQFVVSKQSWVEKVLSKRTVRTNQYPVPSMSIQDIKLVKKEFRNDAMVFLHEQSALMRLTFAKLKLSSARTRWGSCSSRKNINLNWRLALVPQELWRYVAIHELAHLKHMNHSKDFWELVALYDPDYKKHRKELKNYGHFLKEL